MRQISRLSAPLLVAAILVVPAVNAAAAVATPRSPADQDSLAHEILAQLVGMDTTHAVGSAKAVEALAARFRAAGFAPADIYVGGPKPDKMNIVVRLHGRSKAPPVLFNAHLDVVEATRDTWTVDPFVLTEKDGFFYGRGTIDVKNEVSVIAANFIRLKREGFVPDRDLIAFFNTDEEAGGDANGVEWMLKEHRPLIEASLVINQDAGHIEALNGQRLWNTIQTGEKLYATYSLTVAGAGGHSSMPTRDNVIARLARALVRLDEYEFPVRFSETTRAYVTAVAGKIGAEGRVAIEALLKNPTDVRALDALRDEPILNSQVHSTCPATLVQAGQTESALPMQAHATIQCRLLPDEKSDEVLATIRRVIADPAVKVGVLWQPIASPATALNPAVVAKVERVTGEMWPGLPLVPVMSAGASDNTYFRGAGMQAFGVAGVVMDGADKRAHGRDERVAVTAFYESVEFSYRLMKALSAAR